LVVIVIEEGYNYYTTQSNRNHTMTSIKLSDSVSLVCNKLQWSVDYATKVNSEHHLAKKEERECVDHYGDLSRIIPVLTKYAVDVTAINKLRKTYIQCLRDFKDATKGDEFNFSNKIKWSVTQGNFKHTVQTNKDHRGVLVNMQYNTEHHKSEGVAKQEFTSPTHQKAAETLLNKTLLNVVTTDSLDEFIEHLKDETNRIVIAMKNHTTK